MHEGVVHELTGFEGPAFFQGLPYPDRPHYSVFSFEALRRSVPRRRRRSRRTRSRSTPARSVTAQQHAVHGRHGAPALPHAGAAVVRARPRRSGGSQNWIEETVERSHRRLRGATASAELNVDFCAAIPVLTITGSFGISVDDALDIRAALGGRGRKRRVDPGSSLPSSRHGGRHPQDDLISVLCQAECHRRGRHDPPPDRCRDSLVLAPAARGRLGHDVEADGHHAASRCSTRPELLDAVRDDRALLRAAIEESLRWSPTDPMFCRFATRDTELGGVDDPRGRGRAPLPRRRQPRPGALGASRRVRHRSTAGSRRSVSAAVRTSASACTWPGPRSPPRIGALLDRLPNLRLDPDAEQPQIIGMYERGPSEINVLWG